MALIRYATREITAKLVYYGPGLSGKTSNLQNIHSKRAFGKVGELLSLATGGDRTLFFDLLPVSAGTIAGFTLRFQLFTVPGQIFYNKTRKMVLRDADGVVLVGDSSRDARDRNVESLENLKQNLHENGLEYDTIPLVLQFNKRDLPDAHPVASMDAELNDRRVPTFEAVATQGNGVIETLQALMRLVLVDLDRKYNLYRAKGTEEPDPIGTFDLGLPAGPTPPADRAAATPPPPEPSVEPVRNVRAVREPGTARVAAGPPATTGSDGPEAPAAAQRGVGITDLLTRIDALTSELRAATAHQVNVRERDKHELLEAIDELRAPGPMSLEETARYLRVSNATLEALAAKGAIPCTRLEADGQWLFTRALVDEWIAERSRGPT